jgi:hypothetical protein
MDFYVGLHIPAHARQFRRSMISINRLRYRKSDFLVRDWILDSGAFTEVSRHGGFRTPVESYAHQVERWSRCGHLRAAVAQDFMCEPLVLARTGHTVEEHQVLTINRYRELRARTRRAYIMPVLQGWHPADYARHVRAYGTLLRPKMWVGVGSICRRNTKPEVIESILLAITLVRSDLRLHAFGLKLTALSRGRVRKLLASADSMAWSREARFRGRSPNDPAEAHRFVARIETQEVQQALDFPLAA